MPLCFFERNIFRPAAWAFMIPPFQKHVNRTLFGSWTDASGFFYSDTERNGRYFNTTCSSFHQTSQQPLDDDHHKKYHDAQENGNPCYINYSILNNSIVTSCYIWIFHTVRSTGNNDALAPQRHPSKLQRLKNYSLFFIIIGHINNKNIISFMFKSQVFALVL